MASPYNHLLIENHGKVQVIKINNPRKKNALNKQAYLDLSKALNKAAQDESVTVVVLTGVGDFYSSGNDISGLMSDDGENMESAMERARTRIMDFIRAFINFPKILISVVNGPCIGIAATTAALCDVIYCADSAYFHTPFTSLGLVPEGCSSHTFPRILGNSKAAEMLLLNHKMDAQEALRFNFVSEVFKLNEFHTKIWPKILQFSKLPPETVKIAKGLIRKFEKPKLEQALVLEADALHQRWYSEEFINAITAFLTRKSKL